VLCTAERQKPLATNAAASIRYADGLFEPPLKPPRSHPPRTSRLRSATSAVKFERVGEAEAA
jgi:hypothetical protein